jgi:hypothetical protein
MLSWKHQSGGASVPALQSEGTRDASAMPTSARKAGLRRAISMMAPPGTLGTPARMSGSTAMNLTP